MAKFGQSDIFINRDNRTGISVHSGDPLTDVRDLPPYRIEIWVFGNDHEASVFIAGLEAAGTGNALVHDRNLGSLTANKVVIVGRMDDEVAADAPFEDRVSTMEVPRISADSEVIRRHNEKNSAENRLRSEKERAEVLAILDAIGAAHDYAAVWGDKWARLGKGRDESFTITWTSTQGPFSLTADIQELGQGFLDIRSQMQAMAEQYGCVIDDYWELTFKEELPDAEALRAGIAVVQGLIRDLYEERKRIHHQNFVSRTKMSSKWARMIIAGREKGIRTTVVRQMERASIDGDDIGRSDIHTLLNVGWVERGGRGLMPTKAGIDAAEHKLAKKNKTEQLTQ